MEFFNKVCRSIGDHLFSFALVFGGLFLRTRLTRISNDLTIKSIIRLGCCCYWRCVWKIVQFLKKQFLLFYGLERRFCLSLSDNESFQMHRHVRNLVFQANQKIVCETSFVSNASRQWIENQKIINRCWYGESERLINHNPCRWDISLRYLISPWG